MERIKAALNKAKASRDHLQGHVTVLDRVEPNRVPTAAASGAWQPPFVALDPAYLAERRVVASDKLHPARGVFDVFRTKILRLLEQNSWRSLAITSPVSGCGKTLIAVNAAIALSRQPNVRVVLIDLDLQRPSVASTLGVAPSANLSDCIEGKAPLESCFVQVSDNLFLGLNDRPLHHSADLMRAPAITGILPGVLAGLRPTLVIFDLPPVLATADAITFLPQVDACALVIAGGQTTTAEVEEAERELSDTTEYLGLILNKAEGTVNRPYYGATT